MLSRTYHACYADEIKSLAREGGDEKSLKTLVFFEQTSSMPGENLRRLYEEGVLSWHTYAKHSLRQAGVRQAIPKEKQEESGADSKKRKTNTLEEKEKKRRLT